MHNPPGHMLLLVQRPLLLYRNYIRELIFVTSYNARKVYVSVTFQLKALGQRYLRIGKVRKLLVIT